MSAESIDAVEHPLWPGGVPNPIDDVPAEVRYDTPAGLAAGSGVLRNVSDPTLTVFAPPEGTANGVGVVVAPGGGWTVLMWEHEGVDVTRWLNANGYTAFVLKYRVEPVRVEQAEFEALMALADEVIAHPLSTAERPTGHVRSRRTHGATGGARGSARGRSSGHRDRPSSSRRGIRCGPRRSG